MTGTVHNRASLLSGYLIRYIVYFGLILGAISATYTAGLGTAATLTNRSPLIQSSISIESIGESIIITIIMGSLLMGALCGFTGLLIALLSTVAILPAFWLMTTGILEVDFTRWIVRVLAIGFGFICGIVATYYFMDRLDMPNVGQYPQQMSFVVWLLVFRIPPLLFGLAGWLATETAFHWLLVRTDREHQMPNPYAP